MREVIEVGNRTLFKIFIEFVTILLVLCFGFWLQSMWNPSSSTRDGTYTPCIERWRLNCWTTREVPKSFYLSGPISSFVKCKAFCLFVCLASPKPFVTLSSCDSVALIERAGYTPMPIISWAVLCPSHDCGPLYSPCLHKGCLRLIVLSTSHCDPMLG